MSDNLFFHKGGPALYWTKELRSRTDAVMHGVGLNIGSADPLDRSYLDELRRLFRIFQPQVISDHLSFTRLEQDASYELLPIPRTERFLKHLIARVQTVQEYLKHEICLENVSAYVEYQENEMSEGEFFTELCQSAGCGLLLDINNLYVNGFNFKRNPFDELMQFPLQMVRQVHLAGHTDCGEYLFDTHDQPVAQTVIRLLQQALPMIPNQTLPVVLEWDDPHTPLSVLLEELSKIQITICHENRVGL